MEPTPVAGLEDPFSAISHLAGAVVFLARGLGLVIRRHRHWAHGLALALYGVACVTLLALSGAYHILPDGTTGRYVLRLLDHAAIFVLIAASFTPIHAILFRGMLRWGMLALIWVLACSGIVFKSLFFAGFPEWVGLVLYLGIGWLGLVSGVALWRRYGSQHTGALVHGGIAYSVGAVVDYAEFPVLIPGVVGPHEIFHVMVLLGIAWHWRFMRLVATGHVERHAAGDSDRVAA